MNLFTRFLRAIFTSAPAPDEAIPELDAVQTWSCYAFGGGAAVRLDNLTRLEAIAFCAKNLGPVAFVDDDKHFIFFKPPTFKGGQLPPDMS